MEQKKLKKDSDISKDSIENYVSLSYPALKSVLEQMSAKDLGICARVSSEWNGVVKIIRKCRKKRIKWLFSESCDNREMSDYAEEAKLFLDNLPNRPKYVLIFNKRKCVDSKTNLEDRAEMMPISKAIQKFFVSRYTTSRDVIFTVLNSQVHPLQHVVIAFPYFADMEIYGFQSDSFKNTSFYRPKNFIHDYTGVPLDKTIKLILLFFNDKGPQNILWPVTLSNMLSNACTKLKVAIAKIIINDFSFLPFASKDMVHDLYGLAFTGDCIEAMTIKIPPLSIKEEIENLLKPFESFLKDEAQYVAFMFQIHHRDIEYIVFHHLFPKIPLFGVLGTGLNEDFGFTHFINFTTYTVLKVKT